jgi:hypothetical protein
VSSASLTVLNATFVSCVSVCHDAAMTNAELVTEAPLIRVSGSSTTNYASGGAIASYLAGTRAEQFVFTVTNATFSDCFTDYGER